MQAFIKINGNAYPQPSRGLEMGVATITNTGRNANGAIVGQKIGRTQYAISSLEWANLSAETWKEINAEFEKNLFATVEFPDMVNGGRITLRMYAGERNAVPLRFDEDGLPTVYQLCRVNITDVGEDVIQ